MADESPLFKECVRRANAQQGVAALRAQVVADAPGAAETLKQLGFSKVRARHRRHSRTLSTP